MGFGIGSITSAVQNAVKAVGDLVEKATDALQGGAPEAPQPPVVQDGFDATQRDGGPNIELIGFQSCCDSPAANRGTLI